MLKHFWLTVLLFFSIQILAQTGIGTTTPNASARLEVASTNKGFLPPRVTLTGTTDITTIPSPATGLLVYNLGSVGLQAGYYYWNGANWATIATGSTAGNAVVAMDMVKLYGEAYSTSVGKIAHANGFSFTVPVSGRYLFDFSSTAYLNQASLTITFSVRQGTTVLASDAQTSANNNVHVEYSGKLEVNLQSGTTYNVNVNTTGSRDSGDFDRVYYKLVAGNLPVNQHIADRNIQLNNNFLSNDGGNEGIQIDNSGKVSVPMGINIGTGSGLEGGQIDLSLAQSGNTTLSNNVSIDVYGDKVRFFENGGNARGISIDLSKAPNAVAGELMWKTSGIVNAGTFVQLDNLRATVTSSGNRGLSLATVSGTIIGYISGVFQGITGIGNGGGASTTSLSTTATGSMFSWNFPNEGDSSQYILRDNTNGRVYRIILIIGGNYNNNFVSIERLH